MWPVPRRTSLGRGEDTMPERVKTEEQSRQFIDSKTTGKSEWRFRLLAHGQDGHAAESENQEQVHA